MPTKTYGLTSNDIVNAAGMCKMYEHAIRTSDKEHIQLFQATFPKVPQIALDKIARGEYRIQGTKETPLVLVEVES